MQTRYTPTLSSLAFCLFLIGSLGATDALAQFQECTTPELGLTGPEICVSMSQTGGGAATTVRGPATLGSPGLPVVATVGDYAVNLTAVYSFGDAGMGVALIGTITKQSAGSGALIIEAVGGWGTPLDFNNIYCFSGAPTGVPCVDIILEGSSTGVATIETGSSVGFPTGFASGPAEGLTWSPILRTCPVTLYGADTFECFLYNLLLPNQLPPPFPQVAIANTTVVDILNVGTVVDLPSTTSETKNPGAPDPLIPDNPPGGVEGHVSRMCGPEGCVFFFNGRVTGVPTPPFTDVQLFMNGVDSWTCIGPDGTTNSATPYGDPLNPLVNPPGCFITGAPMAHYSAEFHVSCSEPIEGILEVNTSNTGAVGQIPTFCAPQGSSGSISGVKYNDLNANGIRDEGEPGIEGWNIYLDDILGIGDPAATTGPDGTYTIPNVSPGPHFVDEENRFPDWLNATPVSLEVTVTDGTETKNVDFGNFQGGEIHGVKFLDVNGNGMVDAEDTRIDSWQFTCERLEDPLPVPCDPATTLTNSSGEYQFRGLRPGTYRITEETRAGFMPSNPTSGFREFTLGPGQVVNEETDFFNKPVEVPSALPMNLTKEFTDDPVLPGGTVTLEFNIGNPNPSFPGSGIGFTDDLDSVLQGLAPQGLPIVDPCGSGSILSGTTSLELTGGFLPPEGTCTFDVTLNVPPGAPIGIHTNTTSEITATVDGMQTNGASASDGLEISPILDWGDAPESVDPALADIFPVGYPTTLANNGAAHILSPQVRIGPSVDSDPNGQPTVPADGDDTDASDDEDGIGFENDFIPLVLEIVPGSGVLTELVGQVRGTTSGIEVLPSTSGFLDGWVDWNRDGDWDDEGEQIFASEPVAPLTTDLPWVVPATANIGFTYARFRFTQVGGQSPGGVGPVGEVEDYLLYTLGEKPLDSSDDTPDANPGDGVCADALGNCTIRAAIEESNASGTPILISAAALGKNGRVVIQPQTPYPPITGIVLLDGAGSLEIDGSMAGAGANGFTLQGPGTIIANTTIHSFDGNGILINEDGHFLFTNVIRNNGGDGVAVVAGNGNRFFSNVIFDNAELGIDLQDDGVTMNDAGDTDVGPNLLQNSPVFTVVTAENGHIEGKIDTIPNHEVEIDIYTNPTCDASGYGEGTTLIANIDVDTDNLGVANFTLDLGNGFIALGESVTAVATTDQGSSEFSSCFVAVTTNVERDDDVEIPSDYQLFQNYPNPFNPVTTIRFAITNREWVNLEVYDILGKRVATLVDGYVEAGEFTVEFDAADLPSGIYLYRMTAGSFTTSKQLTLLK